MRRLLNLFIAIDQLIWVVITLGNGSPDETLSAAAWRLELEGRWQGRLFRPVIDSLALMVTLGHDKNHCRKAYRAERDRLQLHATYRDN
jgi:hypothetical protein